MKHLYLIFLFAVVVYARRNCRRLEYEDKFLGALKPCEWRNARGMLCMKSAPDVIVWPDFKQSEELAECGFRLRKKKSRARRFAAEDFVAEISAFSRVKRETSYEEEEDDDEFTFSVSREEHRGTKYNFRKILADFVKEEWGKEKFSEIDPEVQGWIENEIRIQRDAEKGVYRVLAGPASEFDKNNKDQDNALNQMREHLNLRKQEEAYAWLNVDKIIMEFEMCHRLEYSSVADQSVVFDAPLGSVDAGNGSTTEGPQRGQSSLGMWYYKFSCMKKAGRMFTVLVMYTDNMTFADVSRKVDAMVNRPETVERVVNGTKQRLEEFIRQEIGYKKYHETGQKCTKYKVPSSGSGNLLGLITNGAAQILGSDIFGKALGGIADELIPSLAKSNKGPIPDPPSTRRRLYKRSIREKRDFLAAAAVLQMGAGLLGLGRKEEKVHCVPYNIERNDPVVFDIKDAKILTDITPEHFVYEVNNWVKETKEVFEAMTITLKQRQNLKAWMRNAMLGEIFIHFRQFLEYDG